MNALLPCWLQLTGGDQGCPRGRFALTMLAAYSLYHLLLPGFFHCATTLGQHGLPEHFSFSALLLILGALMALVSLLLAFLPLSPLALLGVEASLVEAWRLLQAPGHPATPLPEALWPYWLGLFAAAPVLLLAGAVAFGAAWRRLRDAGRSPLLLLLGLTYVLGFGYSGTYSAEASGLYLLGPLWLIILFSQPSRVQEGFAIFRTPPAQLGDNAPAARQNAPAASAKQGARHKRAESRRSLISSPPSPETNRSSAGTRPSPSSDAASYRRRMRERVREERRRS